MISLELSAIQMKDAQRAWIAQAVAEFENNGAAASTLPIEVRTLDLDTAFNGRTQGGKSIELCPSQEAKVTSVAESLTLAEAAHRFHLSEKDLTRLAARMGFKFKRGYTVNPAFRDGDAAMVERVSALRDVGLSRTQVMKQTGMSYEKFHRLLSEYNISFPIVPRRLRNKRAAT